MSTKHKKEAAPRIVFVANLWTLLGHPSPKREWSLAQKFRAIVEADFEAVTTIGQPDPAFAPLLRKHGLRYTGFFSSSEARDFPALIGGQREMGAENINVQIGNGSTPVAEALPLLLSLQKEAQRQGIYVAVESHRATATETPEKIDALADGYRQTTGETLPITWDHSHQAVVKHLKPFLFADVLLRRRDLIQEARLFHCRPFNGQHAQVPVMDARGRLTVEFKEWLGFAEALFQCWLDGSRPGQELWVCPEIGPVSVHGYNLSTMPESWAQAVVCRRELARIWKKLGGAS